MITSNTLLNREVIVTMIPMGNSVVVMPGTLVFDNLTNIGLDTALGLKYIPWANIFYITEKKEEEKPSGIIT